MMCSPCSGPRPGVGPAAAAVNAAVVGFVALILLAMRVYPGGTAWDPTTRGNDFWLNYICDLERGVALDGAPNPVGAALARTGVIVLALGFVPLFWSIPRLFPWRGRRLGLAITSMGCAGAAGSIAVGLLPSDRFGDLHVYTILAAGLPSLAAAALAVAGLASGPPSQRRAAIVGGAMLAVSVIDLGIYLVQVAATGTAPVALAILERCALLLVLAWMVMVVRLRAPLRHGACSSARRNIEQGDRQ